MWFGAWKFCNDESHGLTWVRKMKNLGVVFGVVDTKQDNWQPKLNKLEKSLNVFPQQIFCDRQRVASWTTGFSELSVSLAMERLIVTSSCFPVSSTTLSVRCLRCLRPQVTLRDYAPDHALCC